MKPSRVKSSKLGLVFPFVLTTIALSPVYSGEALRNQDTLILSNEAPGILITRLVHAGYGNFSLYDILVVMQQNTDPSVAGIITPAFLGALRSCPADSPLFTSQIKNIPEGSSVAISSDCTWQVTNIHAYDYIKKPGTSRLSSNLSGVGKTYFIHATSPDTPLTSLKHATAGGNAKYNIFAIASGSVARPAPVSTPAMKKGKI
jgi:hypothetical protein